MSEPARANGFGFARFYLFGQDGDYDDCMRLNAGYRWSSELDEAIEQLGVLARTSC